MKNTFLYLLALLCLSQAANLIRLAHAPAFMIGFWRLLFSSLCLLPFVAFNGSFKALLQKPKLFVWIIISAFFFFLHLWSFFWSAQHTSIANCMILFSLNPLFTAVISCFFMKEHFPKQLYLAYPVAFLGLYFLVKDNLNFHDEVFQGNMSAFVSGIFYSGYLLTGLKVRRHLSNLSYASVMYLTTSMLFGLCCLIWKVPVLNYPSITWIAIWGNVFIPTLMGHLLLTYLLQYMNVNLISCGKLFEPIFSSIVAYYLFQEKLQHQTWLAFLCSAIAVILLFWNQLRTSLYVPLKRILGFRRSKLPQ